MKTCLTIAGSDSSGGAGIQADLKTFAAHGVYGTSAITALTAQNTTGVQGIESVVADFVAQQINAVLNDIPADSIKLGMLVNQDIITCVAQQLSHRQAFNVVLDPVMFSTSGAALLDKQALASLINELIPCVDIITPNVAELVALCKVQCISVPTQLEDINKQTLKHLSTQLYALLPTKVDGQRVAILSKGGHLTNSYASDYLIDRDGGHWLESPRIDTYNTHGTGCTLSAAISANLAQGFTLRQSCAQAKKYLNRALASGLTIGKGNGPLDHSVLRW